MAGMFLSKTIATALIFTTSFAVAPEVRASETSLLQMREDASAQESHTFRFRNAEHCEYCQREAGSVLSVVPFERRPRIASRGLEIAGVSLGALASAAGVTLLALNGRCATRGGRLAPASDSCTHVYSTRTLGVATLTTGAVILGTSLVAIIADSRRGWTPRDW